MKKHIEMVMEVITRKEEENYKKVVDELAKTKDGEKLDSQKFRRIKKKNMSQKQRSTLCNVG